MKLHEKIVFYRKKCGLSQEALAEKIGVSRQAVSKWETGDALPEITKLKSLAEVFSVSVDSLLSENTDTEQPVFTGNKTNIFDKITDWFESLPEKIAPFMKKHGWICGIFLIILGIYKAVMSAIGIFTSVSFAGQFNTAGMGGAVISAALSSLFNLIIAAAIITAGIFIIKKFRPKNNPPE